MTRSRTSRRLFRLSLLSLSALVAFRAGADEESAAIRPLRMRPAEPLPVDRFGLGFRLGFNVKTQFRNFGAIDHPFRFVTPDGDRYNYDNGYVLPDPGTPNSGLTHYWGYRGYTYTGGNQLPGNGTILMQQISGTGLSTCPEDQQALPGVELTYNHEFGRTQKLRWGLEAAFNYMNVSVHDSRPLQGALGLRTDAYPLLVPENQMPPAPYTGRENSPAVVIGANPVSSTRTLLGEIVTGTRRFDADVFGFRVGPYLEIPVTEKLVFGVSGGLALAVVSSDFSYTESIQAGSVRLPATQGAGSDHDLLFGGYVQGSVSYSFTPAAGVFGGVQFQDVGQYTQTLRRKEASLDLSQSLFVTLGLSYTF